VPRCCWLAGGYFHAAVPAIHCLQSCCCATYALLLLLLLSSCRNGLAYILFLEGIPFVYYGAEHGFTQERQPL
jgi:hypothetical protein